jgi:hypothetical protein
MTDRYGTLFWLAVAALAMRAVWEIARGVFALNRGLRAVLLGDTAASAPEPSAADRQSPHTPGMERSVADASGSQGASAAPAVNLLETMSHAEMDELLSV